MNAYKHARQLLPKMPEDIFRLWLDGRIEANGWPPVTSVWRGALREKPFEFWQQLEWDRRIVSLSIDKFTSAARGIINGLIEANFMGIPNDYSMTLADSKERIANIIEYIASHGSLPSTLILMEDNACYEIVDGSHRLAVFFAVGADAQIKRQKHEIWLGSPPPRG